MKKLFILPAALIAGIAMVSFMPKDSHLKISRYTNIHQLNNDGPSAGKTGAPGENNCTQCHTGSAQSGSGVNQVIMTSGLDVVTSYIPGETYNVAVNMLSSSSINGFQIVALTPSNAQAGSVTILPSTGTQVKTGAAGKKYVTHTLAGNVQSSWAFSWTAPATNVGNVTFYLATNKSNAMDNSGGDVIYLSQHVFGSTATTEELSPALALEVGYVPSNHSLLLTYSALSNGDAFMNLVDLNGKSVFTEDLGHTESGSTMKAVKLPESLKDGIYIVHFNINNTFVSKKIFVKH